MSMLKAGSAASIAASSEQISKVKDHIKRYPSKEGDEANIAFKKSNTMVIVILIIWSFLFVFLLNYHSIIKDPIQEELGASSRTAITIYPSRDMFIYRFEGDRVEVPLSDYNLNYDLQNDERIYVYLDDNGNILDFTVLKKGQNALPTTLAMMLLPIGVVVILLSRYIAKRTFGKPWYSYLEWYLEEIDPYRGHPHFAEIERQATLKKLTLK